MKPLKVDWPTLVGWVAVAAVIYAGKRYYSSATASQLAWVLEPTAAFVAFATGANFTFEAGSGWLSRDEMFLIAPECAGVNFLLAAFLTLAPLAVWRGTTPQRKAWSLVTSAVVAYVATIAVNTVRIAVSLRAPDAGTWLAPEQDIHRLQGITVFFTALCALHLASDYVWRRVSRKSSLVEVGCAR